MKLYLVQHGDALPKHEDPERPLSDEGEADVERMAAFLAERGVRVSGVIHSGKRRAEQTAELLAPSVAPGQKTEVVSGIGPMDPPEGLALRVKGWTKDAMVVGHLPYLSRLASRLLTGKESPSVVAFSPGTVVCLERPVNGAWWLVWMVRPELLKP